MPTMDIIPVPQLADNYAWLLRDVDANVNVVIHPSEVGPVIEFLQQRHWHLDAVLNTHHHLDHTGGNIGLKAAYGCEVIGAAADQHRIHGIDRGLNLHKAEVRSVHHEVRQPKCNPGSTAGPSGNNERCSAENG